MPFASGDQMLNVEWKTEKQQSFPNVAIESFSAAKLIVLILK